MCVPFGTLGFCDSGDFEPFGFAMNSVIYIMPLLNKAIIGHLIVVVFLSGLAMHIVLKSRSRISYFVVFIVFIPLLFYFSYSIYAMCHTCFEITSDGLTIVSGLQSRSIDFEEIRDVFVPDSGFKPKLRTFGLALPGFKRGWFQLKNNERGLLFLTTTESAVCIRTHEYVILLSVEHPERFVDISNKYWHENREEAEKTFGSSPNW